MQPAVYGPATEKYPQYWVHNLEHGYVVAAYRCPSGTPGQGDCISQQDLDNIQTWFDNAPAPTKSTCATKVLAVRFDTMTHQVRVAGMGPGPVDRYVRYRPGDDLCLAMDGLADHAGARHMLTGA